MNTEQLKDFLESKGWHSWYKDDYWIHPKLVKDPSSQDYTDYGMSIYRAYEYEMNPDSKPMDGQFLNGRVRW